MPCNKKIVYLQVYKEIRCPCCKKVLPAKILDNATEPILVYCRYCKKEIVVPFKDSRPLSPK